MDNEKILAAAREEKNRGQEYEYKELTRSSLLGLIVALLVGIFLFIVKYIATDSISVELIAVGMTAFGVQSFYESIKVKKTYLSIVGIIQIIIALFVILVFVGQTVIK